MSSKQQILPILCVFLFSSLLISRFKMAFAVAEPSKFPISEKQLYGGYGFSDGYVVRSLLLLPDHRFTYKMRGCTGPIDTNHGIWKLNGDVLELKPSHLSRKNAWPLNIRYIPVKWGKRTFLVDENQMAGFCTAARRAPAKINWPMEFYDYQKGVDYNVATFLGKPSLPVRYQTFYSDGPIEPKVIRLLANGSVVLNKGAADRVKIGMLFTRPQDGLFGPNGGGGLADLKVINVSAHQSRARPVDYLKSKPYLGEPFTTGSFWARPFGTGYETRSKHRKS